MVKRIKKRVEKDEPGLEVDSDTEGTEGADAAAFTDELVDAATEDEFTQYTARVFKWVFDNRIALIGGVAVVLALIVGVGAMNYSQSSAKAEASNAFSQASETYTRAVTPPPPPIRFPGQPEPEGEDLSAAERQKLVKQALGEFEATAADYADRPVAALAQLGAAGAKADLGEHEAALALYEKVAGSSDDAYTRAIAIQGKAAALESLKRWDDAASAWRDLEALNTGAFGLMANLQVARVMEQKGASAEAKALLEKLQSESKDALEDLKNRTLKRELEQRLARLGGS